MIIRGNREELAVAAGVMLAGAVRRVLDEQPSAVLGVPGGRSIGPVLRCFGKEPVDWQRLHLFMVDERFVPMGDPDANYTAVKAAVRPFLAEANLHPFRFDPSAPDSGLEAYRNELAAHGGRFDVILLSSGEDGHVASLFPEHETIIDPAESFIRTSRAPKPPPARMSASRKLLGRARTALLLFLGPEKQDAFALFSRAAVSVEHCPAKLVRQIPEHIILTGGGD